MQKLSLRNDNIKTLFIHLTIPAVISQLVTLAYNIIDRIYIGHMPGSGRLALTGAGVCMPITIILSAFAQLVGFGGAPRASAYLGRNNPDAAERTLGTCALFSLCLSAVLTLFTRGFSGEILHLFGASREILPYASSYFNIYVLGTVFVETSVGLAFFISAQGYTMASMVSVLLGAGLNMLLDPILIFGFHMGTAGAAAATVVSQAASCIWVLAFLLGKRGMIRLRIRYLRFDWKLLAAALSLGMSPFVQILTESLISVCFNRSLFRYGGDIPVGAMTIFATVMQFVSLPITGIAQGAQPIISYNYGAGRRDRVGVCYRLVLCASLTYSVLFWAALSVFPSMFPRIFAEEQRFIAYSASMSGYFFPMLWVMGAQISCQLMFVALGNAKVSLFLALLRKVFLLVPLIFLMPLVTADPVKGIFLAEPISDTLACATTVTLFIQQYRGELFGKKYCTAVQKKLDRHDILSR